MYRLIVHRTISEHSGDGWGSFFAIFYSYGVDPMWVFGMGSLRKGLWTLVYTPRIILNSLV